MSWTPRDRQAESNAARRLELDRNLEEARDWRRRMDEAYADAGFLVPSDGHRFESTGRSGPVCRRCGRRHPKPKATT